MERCKILGGNSSIWGIDSSRFDQQRSPNIGTMDDLKFDADLGMGTRYFVDSSLLKGGRENVMVVFTCNTCIKSRWTEVGDGKDLSCQSFDTFVLNHRPFSLSFSEF